VKIVFDNGFSESSAFSVGSLPYVLIFIGSSSTTTPRSKR
jgi:hypothetical protein